MPDMITIILAVALVLTLITLAVVIMRFSAALHNRPDQSEDAARISDTLYNRILERQRIEAESQRKSYEEASAKILDETRRQYESQITRLEERLHQQAEDLRKASALQFEAISAVALERQSDRLAEESRHELLTLLNPLRENLGEFRKAVNDSYMEENASRKALRQQIDTLISANHEIGAEARRLADALHGNSRMQGVWGEEILESLFQQAGFIRDVHYFIQATKSDDTSLKSEDGSALRPDMIFLLPDDRKIVIDSKTSMTAYLDYCEAATPEDEKAALRRHADSVRRHIDKLGRSQYHRHIKGALEHTLMFMPNDGAFLAILRADRSIAEYALKHNVAIVSPAHLFSILALVAQLWRVDRQNRNAEEIARLGGNLYDKMASFITDFEALDRHLDSVRKAYEKSKCHLSGGSTSISSRAQRLRDLGAKATKNIPKSYLDS